MTHRFSNEQSATIPTLEDIIERNVRRSAGPESLPALHEEYRDVGIAALSAATLCMKYGSKVREKHAKRDRAAA
ncbi:hypothetical protein [Roseibium sp.]|uniref:hypothetical protein n=1 Tax=Roseibium sp. TaxID=1936156 RepID=UPI003B510341